ncbi:hypothetical protein COCC4DRAFT_28696 [Bipolaris maydis ATCC 48331]|uniref:Uncharacterized protein n=1 Tax=Cochliobolus heterostrophus (strain C4 / ATCC 48331 / race T) TaxID=665024 RepID=N4WSE1_COCH4|nr:uncharacterized protein COCC4DRAFT_28696 [Bipolaris maydis ATCC 48331]ENH99112.1 hypothetical protein COCC4DRAFT_28696 [Bipolaris maydis ATCC 48331]
MVITTKEENWGFPRQLDTCNQMYGNMMILKLKFWKNDFLLRLENESPSVVKSRAYHTRDGLPACASHPPVFTTVQNDTKGSEKSADNTTSIPTPFWIECIKIFEFVSPHRSKSG